MINNVTLVGRLTKDPELRYTANSNIATVTFTLAVNRNFTNQQGQREADFISIVIWRKSAELFAQYAKKGSLIGITGRIQTRNYDNQQGQKVYVTEVVADSFQLLESRKAAEDRSQQMTYSGASSYDQPINNKYNAKDETTNNFNQEDNNLANFQGFSNDDNINPFDSKPIEISDDELPF